MLDTLTADLLLFGKTDTPKAHRNPMSWYRFCPYPPCSYEDSRATVNRIIWELRQEERAQEGGYAHAI